MILFVSFNLTIVCETSSGSEVRKDPFFNGIFGHIKKIIRWVTNSISMLLVVVFVASFVSYVSSVGE